ncbi:MAG: AAA family ATPase [Candidatus Methylomirabilales bacterium]
MVKIDKVSLENIKSFERVEIPLKEGITLISGPNGAGKTTVIEAIGYALFNKKPEVERGILTVDDYFLRRSLGVKRGLIRVFITGTDGLAYRVDRYVGSRRDWEIFEVESNLPVDVHGEQERWLREHLGLGPEEPLAHLFDSVIGVEQGRFIEPFLLKGQERKSYFDRILKTEEYRAAYEKSQACESRAKATVDALAREIDLRTQRIEEYLARREELEALDRNIGEREEALWHLEAELREVGASLAEYERLERELRQKQQELELRHRDLEHHRSLLATVEERLREAAMAAKALEEAEPSYRKYLAFEKEVKALETRRAERDGLERERAKLLQKIAAAEEGIRVEEDALRELEDQRAGQEALLKAARGEFQASLEIVEADLAELERKEKAKIDKLEMACASAFQALDIQGEILQQVAGLLGRMADMERAIADDLLPGLERYEEVKAEASREEELIAALKEQRDLESRTKQKIRHLEESRWKLKGKICPLIDVPCTTIEGDPDTYFQARIAEEQARLSLLKEEGDKIEAALRYAQAMGRELAQLEQKRATIDQIRQEWRTLYQELERWEANLDPDPLRSFFQDEEAFASAIPDFATIRLRYDALLPALSRETPFTASPTAEGMHATLAQWQGALQVARDLVGFLEEQVRGLREGLEVRRRGHEADQARLETSIQSIDEQLKRLREEARRTAGRRTLLDRRRQELQGFLKRQKQIEETLQSFQGLDDLLSERKRQREEARPDYERYLQNAPLAAQQKILEDQRVTLREAMVKPEEDIAKLQEVILDLSQRFEPEAYSRLRDRMEKLRKDKAVYDALLEQFKLQRAALLQKVKELEQVMEELAALKRQHKRAEGIHQLVAFLRARILNRAGAPIARRYREHISREADRIYQQISREATTLEWGEGYEVLLRDGPGKVRIFRQLSGGEKMSAALAIRIALIHRLSNLGIGFFDEPTPHLDQEHRQSLAKLIPGLRGELQQLFVVSHDDAFESEIEHHICLAKTDQRSFLWDPSTEEPRGDNRQNLAPTP